MKVSLEVAVYERVDIIAVNPTETRKSFDVSSERAARAITWSNFVRLLAVNGGVKRSFKEDSVVES